MATTSMSLMVIPCLILLSQVQGLNKEMHFPNILCPHESHSPVSTCYALETAPKTWHDAEMTCKKWPSGHLVSVLSRDEAYYVSSLVRNNIESYHDVWIGLHDTTLHHDSYEGLWQWSNKDELSYSNWERNPFTAVDRGYCGSLTEKSGYMKWRDYPCDMLLPYVCKLKQ